jgi:hypothetical protein
MANVMTVLTLMLVALVLVRSDLRARSTVRWPLGSLRRRDPSSARRGAHASEPMTSARAQITADSAEDSTIRRYRERHTSV